MASKILFKRRGTTGAPSSLEYGELAVNYADEKLYIKNSSDQIVELAGGSGGGIASYQSDYINTHRSGGTDVDGEEDASYYDIDLTQSPYIAVDITKSVAIFNGSFSATIVGAYADGTMWANVTSRIISSGNKLRISSTYSTDDSYFVGNWIIIEIV